MRRVVHPLPIISKIVNSRSLRSASGSADLPLSDFAGLFAFGLRLRRAAALVGSRMARDESGGEMSAFESTGQIRALGSAVGV